MSTSQQQQQQQLAGRDQLYSRDDSMSSSMDLYGPLRASSTSMQLLRAAGSTSTPCQAADPELITRTAVAVDFETSTTSSRSSSSSSSDEYLAGPVDDQAAARVDVKLNLKAASLMGVHILDDETEMFFSRQVSPGSRSASCSGSQLYSREFFSIDSTRSGLQRDRRRESNTAPRSPQAAAHIVGPAPLSNQKQLTSVADATRTTTTTMHFNGLKLLRKPRESSSETLDKHFGHYDYDVKYVDDCSMGAISSPTSTLDHADMTSSCISSSPEFYSYEQSFIPAATTHDLRQLQTRGSAPGRQGAPVAAAGSFPASSPRQLVNCLLSLTAMADDTTDEDDIIFDGNAATRSLQTSVQQLYNQGAAAQTVEAAGEQLGSKPELRRPGGHLVDDGPREFLELPDEVCSLEWPIVAYRTTRRRGSRNINLDANLETTDAAGSSSSMILPQHERWSSNSSSWNLSLVPAQNPKLLKLTNYVPPITTSAATTTTTALMIQQPSPSSSSSLRHDQSSSVKAPVIMGGVGTSVVREVRSSHSTLLQAPSADTSRRAPAFIYDRSRGHLQYGRQKHWEMIRDSTSRSSSPPSGSQLGFEGYDRPEEVVHTVDEEDFPFSPIASSFVFGEHNNSVEFSERERGVGGGVHGRSSGRSIIPKEVGPIMQQLYNTANPMSTSSAAHEELQQQFAESNLPATSFNETSLYCRHSSMITSATSSTATGSCCSADDHDDSLTYSLETGVLEPQGRRRQQQQWIPKSRSFHYNIRYNLQVNRSGRFSIDLQRGPRLERRLSRSTRLQHEDHTPEVLIRIVNDAANLGNSGPKTPSSKTSCSQCKCLPVPRRGFLGRCLSSNMQRPRLAVANSFEGRLKAATTIPNEQAPPTGPFQFF